MNEGCEGGWGQNSEQAVGTCQGVKPRQLRLARDTPPSVRDNGHGVGMALLIKKFFEGLKN